MGYDAGVCCYSGWIMKWEMALALFAEELKYHVCLLFIYALACLLSGWLAY